MMMKAEEARQEKGKRPRWRGHEDEQPDSM